MSARPTVLGALRQFLPDYLKAAPPLSVEQRRAIWAITHCRTSAMGGKLFACGDCAEFRFAWHSCNHRACPQCGRAATARWVQRELTKMVNAPYFLVTFTLPAELRGCFFGPHARDAYDLFFSAVSGALSEKLAGDKGLRARINGFTAVLHTWNQQLGFHPHIHCLVPGAGLNDQGKYVEVRQADFLIYLPHLQAAFRQKLHQLFQTHDWQVDPEAWKKDWGVHIQPAGSGSAALKYLGAYVARTAIGDGRMVAVTDQSVSFRWKNRAAGGGWEVQTITGLEFVTRYLRHVLPRGLRSIRYYGFAHPAAKAKRLRVQLHSGRVTDFGATPLPQTPVKIVPHCLCCQKPMHRLLNLSSPWRQRGPPKRRCVSFHPTP